MELSFDVIGNHFPIGRVVLPFHSLNRAVSGNLHNELEFGFPTRTMIEIYGATGVGKSTMATDLASRISQALGDLEIAYLDLEGQDEECIQNTLVNSGYSAKNFRWVTPQGKGKDANSDEKLLEALEETLYEEPPCIGILDSVAAISPTAEVQGSLGDANMGRRAFPMAQFTRRVTRALRMIEIPTVMILMNHEYEKIGAIGAAKQYTSPGGNVKNNLEKLRIRMTTPWLDYLSSGSGKKASHFGKGWVMQGKVEKNRSGTKNSEFQIFVYGGQGIHVGMTALIDCLAEGFATVKTGRVNMDGEDFGLLSKIVDTKFDEHDFFVPFQNRLKEQTIEVEYKEEDDE